MSKVIIEVDSNTEAGQVLMRTAHALKVEVKDSSASEPIKTACPVAPSFLNSSGELMNFQQHMRCRLNRVRSELESMAHSTMLRSIDANVTYLLNGARSDVDRAIDNFIVRSRAAIAAKIMPVPGAYKDSAQPGTFLSHYDNSNVKFSNPL